MCVCVCVCFSKSGVNYAELCQVETIVARIHLQQQQNTSERIRMGNRCRKIVSKGIS